MNPSKNHKKTKPILVVLSGAGMSAESGIATFRGLGGLWEGRKVEDVATPEAFRANPGLVLEFYNARRRNVLGSSPNQGHHALKSLEQFFDVRIVTQNVDDLHERASSSNVLHLHGELMKSRSTSSDSIIYDIDGEELNLGDVCPGGHQLRPHIVWFGEAVPMMEEAIPIIEKADKIIVVGTSMQVYPAASLLDFAPEGVPIHLVDPHPPKVNIPNLEIIAKGAVEGLSELLARFSLEV